MEVVEISNKDKKKKSMLYLLGFNKQEAADYSSKADCLDSNPGVVVF